MSDGEQDSFRAELGLCLSPCCVLSLRVHSYVLVVADEIATKTRELFADVEEEYCSIEKLKTRFEKWMYEHSKSYKEAFIAMAMPMVFSPFVRQELLTWDPLNSSAIKSLQDMKWMRVLFDYGTKVEGRHSALASNRC